MPFAVLDPKRTISLIPSATVYAMLKSVRTVRGEKVLALGDPAYDTRPSLSSSQKSRLRGRGLVRLPQTRAEAKAVGDVVLLGKDASETRLREELSPGKRWRAVHLACHGLVDDALPARSALVLSHDAKNDGCIKPARISALSAMRGPGRFR